MNLKPRPSIFLGSSFSASKPQSSRTCRGSGAETQTLSSFHASHLLEIESFALANTNRAPRRFMLYTGTISLCGTFFQQTTRLRTSLRANFDPDPRELSAGHVSRFSASRILPLNGGDC